MRLACLSVLALGLPVIALAQTEQKPDAIENFVNALSGKINIEGLETTFDSNTSTATAVGDVHIKYGEAEITADKTVYNTESGDVSATGNVTIVKAGVTYQSQAMVYNVNTGKMSGDGIRSSETNDVGTILYSLNGMTAETHDVERIDGSDAFFTTHDMADPNYRVKAKRMTIYPNDRIVMHDVTVYAGKVPVFWFPYLAQPLDGELGYRYSPGYTSSWGAYLLNQYGMIHGDHTLAEYKVDLRSARGLAFGADFTSLRQKNQHNQQWGKLSFYYAMDSSPLTNHLGENRLNVPSDRYRINFQHRIYITGPAERTWYLDFDINKISDEFMYEDFFFREFQTDREPDNQVSLVRSDPRYTATLMTKFQLNDFYRTDTRLPELAFDFTRQPIFNSGFFYQGESSFGRLNEKLGSVEKTAKQTQIKEGNDFLNSGGTTSLSQSSFNRTLDNPPGTQLEDSDILRAIAILQGQLGEAGYTRLHTYHEVLFPKTVLGWLTFVPRVGLGYQQYTSISGGPKGMGSDGRPLVQLGMDVSFKSSKTWDDIKSSTLGLDGLKHTIQPYLNYSYLKADDIAGLTSADPNAPSIAIDRNVATTRPRALDLPSYEGIDSLRSWNVARVGVRNLLQTKRDYTSNSEDDDNQFRNSGETNTQSWNWAGLNSYVDLYFHDPEPGMNRDVSNFYNELFFRPVPWLQFSANTQLPIGGGDGSYTEASYGVTFLPNNRFSMSLSHLYLADHPFFPNSSLLVSQIYAKIDENWGFSMAHRYETATSTLEYQSYSVHRDLGSWVGTLGALVRKSGNVSDFGFIFSMTLKEFPQVSLPLDTDPNPAGVGSLH